MSYQWRYSDHDTCEVGEYLPDASFFVESDHATEFSARAFVSWLNGGDRPKHIAVNPTGIMTVTWPDDDD